MTSPWYENKRFVSALLIALFPVGLYGLWKSQRFSYQTKGIITGLFVLPVLFGTFQTASRESRFVTAGASNAPKTEDHIRRMGISYREATHRLSDSIAMERGEYVNGQDRYKGTSKDHSVSLEIIGDRHAITEAKMIIVPSSAAHIAERNRALLHLFLSNMLPEWPTSADWANTTWDSISTFQEDSVSALRGYKKVTMTQIKGSGSIEVVVKHA
jgi:hypothetical protein